MVTHELEMLAVFCHLERMRLILLLVAMTMGCATQTGPCADRSGSYVVDFSTRSGNCGPQNEGVVNLGATGAPSTCMDNSQASTDNCAVDFNVTCPFNAGQTVEETGQVTWNTDGSSGSGTIQLTLRDSLGDILCEGTYDVNYKRQ